MAPLFKKGDKVLLASKQARRIGIVDSVLSGFVLVMWPDGTGDAYRKERLRKA